MYDIVEGSLEVKLPTIWTDEKQRWEVGRVREEKRRRKRKSQKKEDPGARKSRKVPKHCVFPMICVSGGSTSRLAKAAGAEPAGQMRDEKLHAVVARSTFRSQNVQNTPCTDHFWKFRRRKSARRCGAKHISKSKCTKHTMYGPFLEVQMSKKVHAVVARSTFPSQNVQSTRGADHFWQLRCRKSACRCGAKHISKSKCTKHTMYGPFLEVQMSFRVAGARDCGPCQKWAKRDFCSIFNYNYHYITLHSNTLHYTTLQLQLHLHYTTLHYTTLHSITLNYITLHYTTLHYTTLHYTTLHYTIFHYTTLHYTPLHYTSLHYTTLHSTTLQLHYTTFHYTPLHYTQLHYTTLNSTTFHYTTQHYTALHYTTLHHTTPHHTTLEYTTLHYATLRYTTLHWMTLRHR